MELIEGKEVVAKEDLQEGDWKTCLTGKKELFPMKKGDKGILCKLWTNFYGQWATVELANGKKCDVDPWGLNQEKRVL